MIKKQMKKKIILISLAALVGALGYGLWLFNKPHREIMDEKAAFSVTADQLTTEFARNDSLSHRRYFEQVVELRGQVTKISQVDSLVMITIDPGETFLVSCFLDKKETERPKVNDSVALKGLYVGYLSVDEDFGLPGDIKFRNCFVLN